MLITHLQVYLKVCTEYLSLGTNESQNKSVCVRDSQMQSRLIFCELVLIKNV